MDLCLNTYCNYSTIDCWYLLQYVLQTKQDFWEFLAYFMKEKVNFIIATVMIIRAR